MSKDKICVGQIWEVITDKFKTTEQKTENGRKVITVLKKSEKIEIRYPYEWNYRTIDNKYFHSEPAEILKHCKLYGVIFDRVRFKNKASLQDIINLELYDKI